MNHLLRDLAPFGDDTWDLLDGEARDRLGVALAARKVVDFSGPHGWKHSAIALGRTTPVDAGGLTGRTRRILPLQEVRSTFSLAREELTDFSRGATDVDLTALDVAALELAAFENRTVVHGWQAAGLEGAASASTHPAAVHDTTAAGFRAAVATAVAALRASGVASPYALLAGPSDWTEIVESDDDGYPLRLHLDAILGGPVEWAPGIDGSIVMSTRGGDFELTIGEDLSIGYLDHDAASVRLYVEETLTFQVNTPEAAVAIVRHP